MEIRKCGIVSMSAALIGTALAPAALGQLNWQDGFEDYNCGQAIGGNGIWDCWDGNCAAADSFVNCSVVRTGSKSLEVVGGSDTVAIFAEDECGQGTITAHVFVPSDFAGESYFIVQNQYNHGGPYNWSVQVRMDSALGVVESEFWGNTLPLITNEWVEIRAEVDLDADTLSIFYGGEALIEGITWTDGLNNGSIGELDIGAIDLFANGATPVYYDDLSVTGFSTSCSTCQELSVNRLVGGQNSTFSVVSVDNPGASFGVIYFLNETAAQEFADCAASAQSNSLSELVQCYGGDPRETLACQGRLNGDGEGTCSVNVPNAARGRTISFVSVVQTASGFCASRVLTQEVQ